MRYSEVLDLPLSMPSTYYFPIYPQTPSYPALPFLGKARSPAINFGIVLCAMATCRTSLSSDVVPSRASARVDNGRRQENHDAIKGGVTGEEETISCFGTES